MKGVKHFRTKLMKGVGANVIILGLVSLFTDLGSQMVFPLIPLFLDIYVEQFQLQLLRGIIMRNF